MRIPEILVVARAAFLYGIVGMRNEDGEEVVGLLPQEAVEVGHDNEQEKAKDATIALDVMKKNIDISRMESLIVLEQDLLLERGRSTVEEMTMQVTHLPFLITAIFGLAV
jgi:hypothetical protein